ncbi:MAG: hypothetical protein DRN96_02560 [Thermoproteota archaeon]|nr:MAG: hypothetical protein DRN96_02560 [Candidatus Korarchaeota archaeon]
MRVIGVIDMMGGVAVRAIRGERERYRPVECKLCRGSRPIDIAEGYRRVYKVSELYVADLDAIMERGSNLDAIKPLVEAGFSVMVDAGVRSIEEAEELVEAGCRVILATETADLSQIEEMGETLGWRRVTISLDFKGGRLLSKGSLRGLSCREAAEAIRHLPASEVIVLELSRVGTLTGPPTDLVKAASAALKAQVLAGGGIRGLEDLRELKKAGASGALMATALQDMLIPPEDIKEAMKL